LACSACGSAACGSAAWRPASIASADPAAPAATAASAHFEPVVSMPSARSMEGEPGPDRWPLTGELEALAARWSIDPRRDLAAA